MTANPLLDRRNAKLATETTAGDGGPQRGEYPYTVQGHVDWLNARVDAGKAFQRWEVFTQRNSVTKKDEVSCRPVSRINAPATPAKPTKPAPYAPVVRKALDW